MMSYIIASARSTKLFNGGNQCNRRLHQYLSYDGAMSHEAHRRRDANNLALVKGEELTNMARRRKKENGNNGPMMMTVPYILKYVAPLFFASCHPTSINSISVIGNDVAQRIQL